MNPNLVRTLSCRYKNNALRYIGCTVLPGVVLTGFCAQVQAVVPEGLSELNVPGFQWQVPQSMRLSGVQLHIRHFSSNSGVMPAAQSLATYTGLFQRVLTIRRKVVLSGLSSGWHWLAEIDASSTGAHGYVSALHTGAQVTGASPFASERSFAWLPPQARRQFDHQHIVDGRRVMQQVYSIALPIPALTSYVRRQLRTDGWLPEPQLAGSSGGMAWGKAQARLLLFAQQGTAGTSLYVHYIE